MKEKRFCKYCNAELTKASQKVFCSAECNGQYKAQQQYDRITECGYFPVSGKFSETNRHTARVYLERRDGHKCMLCGRTTWSGKPIPLVVDHIDGNSSNHAIDNVRLICPNCDALLPTYKSRNTASSAYTRGGRYVRHLEEYERRLERAGLTRDKPRERAKGTCPACGKVFEKKYHKQKYCSRPCADLFRKRAA